MKKFLIITGGFLFLILLVVFWRMQFLDQEGFVIENKKILTQEERKEEEKKEDREQKQCVVSGCSGELCVEPTSSEEGFASICVWEEEYECYREAVCERQKDGECGWTQTESLQQCLENKEVISPEEERKREDEEQNIDTQESQKEVFQEEISTPFSSPIDTNNIISWGYTPSTNRSIDTIILHSSFNSLGGDPYDVEAILDIYKSYDVGAHYIIDREGNIIQLIEDNDIAYHAGVSSLPDGRTKVNEVSIGIEIVANYEDGYTKEQYKAVDDLLDFLKNQYSIKYILGHNEIAPERKTDPWNFDWERIERS